MALQSGDLIQDENLNVHYNGPSVAGKANALNSQIKSGPKGRKPLGDLSNLRSSILNQSSKKKPDLHGASKKKKQSLRVSTVTKETLHHSAVFEEGFLHNHEECIKAQNSAVYRSHLDFLRSIGLDAPKEVATLTKKFDDSPCKLSDLPEEMEWSEAYCSPRGKSPRSPSPDPFLDIWKDSDIVDFSLIWNIGLDAPKEVTTLTKKFDDSPRKLSDLPEKMEWSDACCSPRGKSPRSPSPNPFPSLWKHSDIVDFRLIGSPSQLKLA